MNHLHTIKKQAFLNALHSLKAKACMPAQVFDKRWVSFRFFESDHVFSKNFVQSLKILFQIETSTVACLINLDRVEQHQSGNSSIENDALYFEPSMDDVAYANTLLGLGRPDYLDGWFWHYGPYVCSSEKGQWCIYLERNNDVAVIGFQNQSDVFKFSAALELMWAKPIAELMGGPHALVPYNQLAPEWKQGLVENYPR